MSRLLIASTPLKANPSTAVYSKTIRPQSI